MSIIKVGCKQTFSAIVKMLLHKMAETENEEVEFSVLYHLVAREFNIQRQYLLFHSLYTLFSSVNKIVKSCAYIGLSGCSSI